VSEPPPPPEIDDEDDLAFVLESIEFMMRLKSLSQDSKRELAEIRSRLQRFEVERRW